MQATLRQRQFYVNVFYFTNQLFTRCQLDSVPARVLKQAASEQAKSLAKLFQLCFDNESYLSNVREHKKKDARPEQISTSITARSAPSAR